MHDDMPAADMAMPRYEREWHKLYDEIALRPLLWPGRGSAEACATLQRWYSAVAGAPYALSIWKVCAEEPHSSLITHHSSLITAFTLTFSPTPSSDPGRNGSPHTLQVSTWYPEPQQSLGPAARLTAPWRSPFRPPF